MSDTLGVYTIVDRKTEEDPDRKSLWVHIGIAFVNRDGSINARLNALPVNGTVHIRPLSSASSPQEPEADS
jgi:hypothetical protein